MNKQIVLGSVKRFKMYYPVLTGIAGLFILGQIMSPGFASVSNINTILALASILAMAAIGQSLVIFAGEFGIDLSLGAIMSTGVLITSIVTGGENDKIWLAVLATIGIGMAYGFINGVGVQMIKIPPLAMTLVMATVINGIALAFTNGHPPTKVPKALKMIGRPLIGNVRTITVIVFVVLILTQLFLTCSRYGRTLFLVGSNRKAARLSGIRVNAVVISAYTLAGIYACVSGVLLVGWVGNGQMGMGNSYTMMSVAASVIGGAKLSGGHGTVVGTSLGAIVIILMSNLLIAAGLSAGVRTFFEGIILILILLANNRAPKLRA